MDGNRLLRTTGHDAMRQKSRCEDLADEGRVGVEHLDLVGSDPDPGRRRQAIDYQNGGLIDRTRTRSGRDAKAPVKLNT